MVNSGFIITCPRCKKKADAPEPRDGVLFSCILCNALLRWRLRGTRSLLELVDSSSKTGMSVKLGECRTNVVTGGNDNDEPRNVGLSFCRNLFDRRLLLVTTVTLAMLAGVGAGLFFAYRGEVNSPKQVSPPLATSNSIEQLVQPQRVYTKAELLELFQPSVCKIVTPESSGTGFLVAPGVIATNKHVVGCWDTTYLRGEFLSGSTSLTAGTEAAWEVRNLKLAYATDDFDLCFLRAESIPPSCRPIPPANMDQLTRGQEVVIIGCPYGQEGTITPGVLNQLRNDIDAKPLLSLSAAVNPGNSGGPVITMFGESAGVVVLKHSLADGLGYAVPASAISESLRNLATQTPSQIEQNTSGFKCQQTATAIFLCTIETGKMLSLERATRSPEESIARITFLLSNTQVLIQSVKSSGVNRSAAELLSDALSQIERIVTKVKSGSDNGLISDIDILEKLNERLKFEIGYLEFERP